MDGVRGTGAYTTLTGPRAQLRGLHVNVWGGLKPYMLCKVPFFGDRTADRPLGRRGSWGGGGRAALCMRWDRDASWHPSLRLRGGSRVDHTPRDLRWRVGCGQRVVCRGVRGVASLGANTYYDAFGCKCF